MVLMMMKKEIEDLKAIVRHQQSNSSSMGNTSCSDEGNLFKIWTLRYQNFKEFVACLFTC